MRSSCWSHSIAGASWRVGRLRGAVVLLLLCMGVIGLLASPDVAAQTTTDYDTDNDGLIEVANLAQLNAIRWDLDGDGAADDASNDTDYATAFPAAAAGMGCPSTGCIGYELTANLDFDTDGDGDVDADDASGAYWNSGHGWAPVGYELLGPSTPAFRATFEGNNRTIANLFINRPSESYVGLFGLCYSAGGAEIRKVRLLDVDVTGYEYVGGLVGSHEWTGVGEGPVISNSSATGTVSGQQFVGGLVGKNAAGATVSSSHVTGDVTGTDPATSSHIGGLVGLNDGSIEDSYHQTGTVSGYERIGGLVGYGYLGTIRDGSYASSIVTGQYDVGGLVGRNAGPSTISSSHATGDVTGTDPATSSHIGGLVGWNAGTIEDSYHETGTVSGATRLGGLVGKNNGGTISDSHATSTVTGTDPATSSDIGGLAGYNDFTIEDSYHETGTVSGGTRIGGLVGYSYSGSISGSHASGAVLGQQQVGGLVGENRGGAISDSHATGDVTGTDPATSSNIGGLVGRNELTIKGSYHETGTVSGYERIGGLVGYNYQGTISDDSYASSTVAGQRQVGGLVGRNEGGAISDSHASGAVSGQLWVGGLVGSNAARSTIGSSHATGTVTGTGTDPATSSYIGGLVGYSAGSISASYARGNVLGLHSVGGLVGWNAGSISVSYAKGKVSGAFQVAGGLVGQNNGGKVRASYATGNVIGTGTSRVAGGLVGRNWDGASIVASYATGRVSATGGVPDPDNAGQFLPINVGGLVGMNLESYTTIGSFYYRAATVEHSYWDTDTSAVVVGIGNDDADDSGAIDGTETAQDGATGKTTSELQALTDYTDSDPDTEDIYAAWNLDVDDDRNTGDPTTGADDPWDFGTTSQYPLLRVDFNGDGSINADDINLQRSSGGNGGGGGGSSSGGGGSTTKKSSSGGGSRAPSPPPAPTRSPIIGSTPAATAKEVAGDLLVLQRHDQPGVEIEVGVGWMSQDGQRIIVIGFVRDGDLGQTYAVVRREGDSQVVRRWIAPDSPLVYAVPWALVNTQYTFPVQVILAIPLDDQYPWPNMLARRFDGGDDRIVAYDAELGQWRHVPDEGTFQTLGFYWCNVTAADAGFFERITLGPPYPSSGVTPRADYPVCQT